MKLSSRNITLVPTLFAVTFALSCFVIDPCSVDDNNYAAREQFHYYYDTANLAGVQITGINGSIELLGRSNITTAEIWGEKMVESESKSDALTHLDYLQVDLSTDQNTLCVTTVQPQDTEGRNYTVTYHLLIPLSWIAGVTNLNGNIELDSLKNTINATLVNGEIVLRDINAHLYAGVTNGKISGDVSLPPSGSCHLGIINGEIDIEIPKDTSADLSAEVVNGSIHVSDLVILNLQTSPKSLRGTLGVGNGVIHLTTINGPIYVQGF